MESWRTLDRDLVLASQSPRRREILKKMEVSFRAVPPGEIDEESYFEKGVSLEESLVVLASEKALSIVKENREALVLGADTIVAYDGRVIGKPKNRADARAILKALSGQTHIVYTGVALMCGDPVYTASRCVKTAVTFRELSDEEIEFYLDNADYMDKAGAYAIQEEALTFVEYIEGCYYNIVGLPVTAVISLFEEYHETGGDII